MTEQVYRLLCEKAERVLASGHGAIVDAVFAAPEERMAIAAVAERAGCAFVGLWLDAPATALLARVEARRGDASDADAAVVRSQLNYDLGEVTWRRIDATGPPAAVLAHALSQLKAGNPR